MLSDVMMLVQLIACVVLLVIAIILADEAAGEALVYAVAALVLRPAGTATINVTEDSQQ